MFRACCSHGLSHDGPGDAGEGNRTEGAAREVGDVGEPGDDLSAALALFETKLEASRAGRREHVGASADLEAEIAEQVKVLDGLVRFRFGENAELMGAWASARNVLGPFKPKAGDQPKAT